jgi:hypothetical protein
LSALVDIQNHDDQLWFVLRFDGGLLAFWRDNLNRWRNDRLRFGRRWSDRGSDGFLRRRASTVVGALVVAFFGSEDALSHPEVKPTRAIANPMTVPFLVFILSFQVSCCVAAEWLA